VLARVGAAAGRRDFLDAAALGVRYAADHQRPDGSWPYGERPGLEWVDNFHTGYVLDCLRICRESGVGVPDGAIDRGLAHYRTALFDPDGAPRYSTGSRYPLDIQCVAQAIHTLSLAGDRPAAERVHRYWRRRMRRRDGGVLFQRRRLWANRASHMRWGVGPMLSALARLAQLERSSA
jgi:hypothetical protein